MSANLGRGLIPTFCALNSKQSGTIDILSRFHASPFEHTRLQNIKTIKLARRPPAYFPYHPIIGEIYNCTPASTIGHVELGAAQSPLSLLRLVYKQPVCPSLPSLQCREFTTPCRNPGTPRRVPSSEVASDVTLSVLETEALPSKPAGSQCSRNAMNARTPSPRASTTPIS